MQIKGYLKADGTYDKTVTIGSGVTLLIPYEDGKRNPSTGEAELTTYTKPTTTNLVTLTSGVTLTISQNAILEIGGQRFAGQANSEAGSTAGNTAVLELGSGASIICSGSINLFGFIDETEKDNSSSVTINNGASITMPFVIYDFRGGTASSVIYTSGKEAASVFNRFAFVNVVPTLIINYGGDLYGVANLYGDSKVNYATGHIVGDDSTSVLQLTDGTYSKLIAKLDEARKVSHIQIVGGAKTNGLQLTLLGQDVDTADYVFGIGYNFDIILSKADGQSNAIFEMGQLYKLLPGAKLTIDKGATLKLTGKMNIYSEGWVDNWKYTGSGSTNYTSYTTTNAWTGEALGPAMLIVKGTLDANVLGADQIYVYPGASITIKTTTWTTKDIEHAIVTILGSSFTSVTQTLKQLVVYNSEGVAVTLNSNGTAFDLSTAYIANTGVSIKLLGIKNGAGIVGTWYDAKSGGNNVGDAGTSYTPTGNITIYPQWSTYTVTYNANGGSVNPSSTTVTPGGSITLPTPNRSGYSFNGWYTAASGGTKIGNAGASYTPTSNITLYAQWSSSCVTGDALVSLADGTQVKIKNLQGDEQILVWNHYTGKADVTSILVLFNNNGETVKCDVLRLEFSDGTYVEIIGEHVFFDKTLNKYVGINAINVTDFIGHNFAKISNTNDSLEEVTLVGYETEYRITDVYDINANYHHVTFVNGMLSCSAYSDISLNCYEFFGDNLGYSEELMQEDIEKYGIYTYEDFEGLLPKEIFEAFHFYRLKICVAKGYTTWEEIVEVCNAWNSVG